MSFRKFNSELRIGRNTVIDVQKHENGDVETGEILLYGDGVDKVLGVFRVNSDGMEFLRGGRKLRALTVNQFKKSIK